MPSPRRFTLAAVVATIAVASPAAAETIDTDVFRGDAYRESLRTDDTFQPVTHQVELRFGMAYDSNRGVSPRYGARYTMTLHHRTDNGLQMGFSVGVQLDNFDNPAPWRPRGPVGN
ncbi:MAG: hypothetical protein HLUCCA12_12470 [Rhodobacteraceae bacterium HLUCCA12]|nr:MAG: hypothetical protein HLUCCA12_12470 [Rhodobacteraceae bacterium HLUCCA12]